MGSNAELYEQDFYAWTQTTAALIREEKWYDLDREALAEVRWRAWVAGRLRVSHRPPGKATGKRRRARRQGKDGEPAVKRHSVPGSQRGHTAAFSTL